MCLRLTLRSRVATERHRISTTSITAARLKDDQGIIRIDYHPTANDAIWASSVFESEPTFNLLPFGGATLPGFSQVNTSHIKVFDADFSHIFNSGTINELRAGYFGSITPRWNPQRSCSPIQSDSIFPPSPQQRVCPWSIFSGISTSALASKVLNRARTQTCLRRMYLRRSSGITT